MIRLKQNITFSAGEVTDDRPVKSTFSDHYIITIPMGKDATATLCIPQDAVDDNPEIFEKYVD